MRTINDSLTLSATDLAAHLGCRHLTQLNLRANRGELKRPYYNDSTVEVLRQKGIEHERNYLGHLQAEGLSIVKLPEHTATPDTLEAMRSGAEVIFQAALDDGRWRGRADFLLRTAGASDLGDYHYEVVDTKLARETRAGTVLQLCFYAELVGELQGRRPDRVMVVSPGKGFVPEVFRVDHYSAYYSLVKRRLGEAVMCRQLWAIQGCDDLPAFGGNLPQIDHVFPQSALKRVKAPNPNTGSMNIMKYREGDRNQLANCMLLTAAENGAGGKSDTLPDTWFRDKDAAYLDRHLIPPEPLRKALRLPRVSLFIADDTGLGKTIEAGLIARELLLRKKVKTIVVAAPPSVLEQWKGELEDRFGLVFEILDRSYLTRVRRDRGFGMNPWRTHSRFLVSHNLLIDATYADPLREWLGRCFLGVS